MTKREHQRQMQHRKWRRQEEQALRVIRDFAAKRLRDFGASGRARILKALYELGV